MWRPLHLAGITGDVDIATALLDAGADINSVNADSQTCLHLAASYQHHDLVVYLVTKVIAPPPPTPLTN